jgi:hypothetical protein
MLSAVLTQRYIGWSKAVTERRRYQRIRTLDFGKMLFSDGTSPMDCIVRNLSYGGACLQVESTVGLPQKFYLKIPINNLKRTCRVAWEFDNRIGVAFQ